MPRLARIKSEGEGFYHLYCKAAGGEGEYPFEHRGVQRKFIEILKFYSEAFDCKVYAYVVMGNHYHVVVHFKDAQGISDQEAIERAKLFYPNSWEQSQDWTPMQMDRFKKRLFDVSEFMRSVQMSFSKWYNRKFKRKGSFWAERFKSTLLLDEESILKCMQYIELNPIRAGMIKSNRPEDYRYSSLYERNIGLGKWLVPLKTFLNESSEKKALIEYKAQVYYRGSIKTKEKQREIPLKIVQEQEVKGFQQEGIFSKQCRYYCDGLVLGLEDQVQEWVEKMRFEQVYQRRNKPIPLSDQGVFSLREQRNNYIRI